MLILRNSFMLLPTVYWFWHIYKMGRNNWSKWYFNE